MAPLSNPYWLCRSIFVTFVFVLLVHFQILEAIECPTKTENKCEKFWHPLFKYPGHNLRKGLKCLNYNKNITSVQALGNTSLLQHINFETLSLDITQVDEIKGHIRWRWNYVTSWIEDRLKWPIECQIKGQTSTDFVKSELLNSLWNAVDFIQDAAGGRKKQSCQNTIQINQVLHIPFQKCTHLVNVATKWQF